MNEELEKLNSQITSITNEINKKIESIGRSSELLNTSLKNIGDHFALIRGIPNEEKEKYLEVEHIRNNWENQVKRIEETFKTQSVKNIGTGAIGVGAGVAVAALGPSVAMGVATTFGVASTGTAISALSGAAATNAALAWLGGGAVAAGGAGVAGGKALLAFAGPLGWTIAIASFAFTGFFIWKSLKEKKRAEEIIILIADKRYKKYSEALVEMQERIKRMDNESKELENGLEEIKTFGLDYESMSLEQKYKLGSYVNLMQASIQLLIKPIEGLQPNFTEKDYDHFIKVYKNNISIKVFKERKDLIILYANEFYGIDMNYDDFRLMWKIYRKNKDLLNEVKLTKDEFVEEIFHGAQWALECLNR